MRLSATAQQVLRKLGYTDGQNLGEFWAANEPAISRKLASTHPHEYNKLTEQVRWMTPMGQACQAAVREHIDSHRNRFQQIKNELVQNRADFASLAQIETHPARRLSFDTLSFEFQGIRRTLDDFQKLGRSQIHPAANLRGINLSGIHFADCEIFNACFQFAILDGAYISQVTLNRTTFTGASIRDARIVMMRIHAGSLSGIDVCGSYLERVMNFNGRVS